MGKRAKDNPAGQISRREFFKKSFSLATALGASSLILGSAANSEASTELAAAAPSNLGTASGGSSLAASTGGTAGATAAATTAPATAGAPTGAPASLPRRDLSRALVILARKADRGNSLQAFYKTLLDASVKRLANTGKPEDAWARFFKPDDVVAIKVNSITGKRLSTSPALANAIAEGLMSCGVRPDRIIVWDRTISELDAAGFQISLAKEGPLCFGTDAPSMGYETSPTVLGAVGSCFSRIVTGDTTALINVPLLREHELAGVSISLKNNYGAIHNPNKYHADGCTPFVADVNTHPAIKKKTRLVICDALNVQFQSGPGYKPKWVSNFGGILVSTDPVAVDTVATEEIEKLRKAAGLRSLAEEKRYPGYLSVASDDAHALGISDRSRIDVINMELT
jgi:uncharacterized protein (DUF362 family)